METEHETRYKTTLLYAVLKFLCQVDSIKQATILYIQACFLRREL